MTIQRIQLAVQIAARRKYPYSDGSHHGTIYVTNQMVLVGTDPGVSCLGGKVANYYTTDLLCLETIFNGFINLQYEYVLLCKLS